MAEATVFASTPAKAAATTHHHQMRSPMRWFVLALLLVLLVFTLFPFFLAVLNAFKPGPDYVRGGPLSIPGRRAEATGMSPDSSRNCDGVDRHDGGHPPDREPHAGELHATRLKGSGVRATIIQAFQVCGAIDVTPPAYGAGRARPA